MPTTSNSHDPAPIASTVAAPAAVLQIGEVVTAPIAASTGLLAYALTDGSKTVISPGDPLPSTVITDIDARLAKILDAYPLKPRNGNSNLSLSRFAQILGDETGKQVMIVAPVFLAVAGQKPTVMWSVIENKNFYAKSFAVAYAARITAIQPNPEEWLTVVAAR